MINYQHVPGHALEGRIFTDHVQPYGTRSFVVTKVNIAGEPMLSVRFPIGPQMIMQLEGVVTEGRECSLICGMPITSRDITGAYHCAYGVRPEHLAAMEKITVNCG